MVIMEVINIGRRDLVYHLSSYKSGMKWIGQMTCRVLVYGHRESFLSLKKRLEKKKKEK